MQAFFALSIGMERLTKLIVLADFAISNGGLFPTNQELKDLGHDIERLMNRCEEISLRYRSGEEYSIRPTSHIHQGIVTGLREFGVLSRYYNLDFIAGGKAAQLPEPIDASWRRVGVPILAKHYSKAQRQKDEDCAADIAVSIARSFVLHHAEDGNVIDDPDTLFRQAMATRIVQKYGQLCTLQIIRWLAFLISDLAAGAHKLEAFFGLSELFKIFLNDDQYLKGRKTFSIYSR